MSTSTVESAALALARAYVTHRDVQRALKGELRRADAVRKRALLAELRSAAQVLERADEAFRNAAEIAA